MQYFSTFPRALQPPTSNLVLVLNLALNLVLALNLALNLVLVLNLNLIPETL
jgi:hypothetical protein